MATLALLIFGAAQSKIEVNGSSATDQSRHETAAANPAKDSAELIIAILLYDKMTALDAIGLYEVLHRLPNAKVKFVGETAGLKTADSQMLTLRADYSIDEVPHPDVLLIPGGDARAPRDSKKVVDWITNAHKTTK